MTQSNAPIRFITSMDAPSITAPPASSATFSCANPHSPNDMPPTNIGITTNTRNTHLSSSTTLPFDLETA